MGQYLAAGVMTKIKVVKRKDMFGRGERFNDSKEDIIKQIGKFINLDHYNVEIGEDYISINMDTEYFNNNIHEAYLKFNNILDLSDDSYKFDKYFNLNNPKKLKFNQENFPIKLFRDDKGEYQIDSDDDLYSSITDYQAFASNSWMFYEDDQDLWSVCKVYVDYVRIYTDIEKIIIEDDRNLLTALNVLCNKIFNDGLTKDIGFYISG